MEQITSLYLNPAHATSSPLFIDYQTINSSETKDPQKACDEIQLKDFVVNVSVLFLSVGSPVV